MLMIVWVKKGPVVFYGGKAGQEGRSLSDFSRVKMAEKENGGEGGNAISVSTAVLFLWSLTELGLFLPLSLFSPSSPYLKWLPGSPTIFS